MKKLLILALGLATTMCTFTSCDEDEMQGVALSGCWEGDFGMSYDYQYRGEWYTVDADYTDLEFIPYSDSYRAGYGYQVDFYRRGPWDKVYHSFSWEIRSGTIYLDYCQSGENELNTFLRDYEMTNNYLRGYFGYSNTPFRLTKYKDYYDWSPYYDYYGGYRDHNCHGNGWGYYDNNDWDWGYYSPTRAAEGDSVASAADAPKMIRYYNRNMDK